METMLKVSLYFLLLFAIAQPSFGQAVSECRLQSDPATRLGCYDAIYPPSGSSLAEPRDGPNPSTPRFDYSWVGVPVCRTISRSPAFKFTNFPPNTRSVLLVL